MTNKQVAYWDPGISRAEAERKRFIREVAGRIIGTHHQAFRPDGAYGTQSWAQDAVAIATCLAEVLEAQ